MKVKVFQPNSHGKIEFNPVDLEKLLNEVYSEGYRDGKSGESNANSRALTWISPSPSLAATPYYDTISTCGIDADKPIDRPACKSVNANDAVPSIYTIDLGKCDSEVFSKAISEIVSNARKSFLNQASHKDNGPIANLKKELGL